MNFIAKIKRLEAEAAERDKRIAALEAQTNPPPQQVHGHRRNGVEYVAMSGGGYVRLDALMKSEPGAVVELLNELPPEMEPKKRKPRAKTSGTE